MKVKFLTVPAYIEGSSGLYSCKVEVMGKTLILYFTDDMAISYRELIMKHVNASDEVQIGYVIVKDEQKKAYTYFMEMEKN